MPRALVRSLALVAGLLGTASLVGAQETQVLFQAFPWNAAVDGQKYVWYRHLEDLAPELAEAGITHVWYPPVSRSVAPQGYMPGDLYDLGSGEELGDNRTLYGNLEELKSSLRAFKERGVVPVLDAVLNHRCGNKQEDGHWNVYDFPSEKANWRKWALVRGDYGGTGAPDSGADFAAAPDIDHTQAKVRDDLSEWLRWMKDEVGFEGVRFDFTKGYAPVYARGYAKAMGAKFAVGEYWTSMSYGDRLNPNQDPHRQELADWVDGTQGEVATFDFTTKGILQEALASGEFWRLKADDGRASGFLGWWPAKAVTFVDNHDTGSEQNHWPFPSEKVAAGYAYILTHPGTPTIFYDHWTQWGEPLKEEIQALLGLRHRLDLHAKSKLEILEANGARYLAEVDSKLWLVLGDSKRPNPEAELVLEGDSYQVYVRPE